MRCAVRTGRGAVAEARRAARPSQGEVKLNDVRRARAAVVPGIGGHGGSR